MTGRNETLTARVMNRLYETSLFERLVGPQTRGEPPVKQEALDGGCEYCTGLGAAYCREECPYCGGER